MSGLIIPITIILLRGALSVLLLAGAEAVFEHKLSARVRRVLWIICIFSMVLPQPDFSFQPFGVDMSRFHWQVVQAADARPWSVTEWMRQSPAAPFLSQWANCIPGLSRHNYPYFLAMLLMIVPAGFMLFVSYIRERKRTADYKLITDERINRIWHKVRGKHFYAPRLLDSGAVNHPPVLFGCFRQKVLLPVASMKDFSDLEVELLLTHEFIHYRSGDGWVNLLTLLFWPFCWFNPFFIAARKYLRINCELACDAEVIKRYPDCIKEYGNLLLKFAGKNKIPENVMAFGEYSNELKKRIFYILYLPRRQKSSPTVTLLLVLLLIAPFGLFSTVPPQQTTRQVYSVVQK